MKPPKSTMSLFAHKASLTTSHGTVCFYRKKNGRVLYREILVFYCENYPDNKKCGTISTVVLKLVLSKQHSCSSYECILGILTLANDQFDAQIFNTFITVFHMYMSRAWSCSSSGGEIVLIQHLVSSLSVSDHPVHSTGRSLTESDDTRCCINTIWPPEDEQDTCTARNTYM